MLGKNFSLHKNKTNVCYVNVIGIALHKRMKDVAMTCVLRAVKASKYVCGRWGNLQRSPDPLAGYGEGTKGRKGTWKGMEEVSWGEEEKVGPPSNPGYGLHGST